MLSERILNDPAVYMRLRGHPPTTILECAICPTRFVAKDEQFGDRLIEIGEAARRPASARSRRPSRFSPYATPG